MFVLDTNVIVYAVDGGSPFHAACRATLDRLRLEAAPGYVTWSIVYEFVRVVTHAKRTRRLSAAQAWDTVEALLASPGLDVLAETDRHAAVAREVVREVPDIAGNFVHDAHIATLMREHGIRRIYTRDTGFHRFPFLEPVDPARPSASPGAAERAARYHAARRRTAAHRPG